MSYQFLDANSSILSAQSSTIGGIHYPVVIVASVLGGSQNGASIIGNVPIKPDILDVVLTPTSSTNGDLYPSTDVSMYRSATIQLSGSWTGTVLFQGSNDNLTFFNLSAHDLSSQGFVASTTTNRFLNLPINFKYLRVRMTSFGSGSVLGEMLLHTLPPTQVMTYSAMNGTWAIGSVFGGGIAHDQVDVGSPIKMGGYAINAERAAVANADRADFITDLTGKQIVLPYANPENFVWGTSSVLTGTTASSILAAPGSGLRNYITTVKVTNAAATAAIVDIKDSGGNILDTGYAAASGGGWSTTFPTPIRQTTTNASVDAVPRSQASILVQITGYKGA
jgi:hypothetical protein